jgi:Hemerythrin HHE cation binding domain
VRRTADRPAGVADLAVLFAVHRAMRDDIRRLPQSCRRLVPEASTDITARQRWFAIYRRVLTAHHRSEDEVVFPEIARRVPGFEADRERLAGDHEALDAALDATARSLRELSAAGAAGWDAALEAVDARSGAINELLGEHLPLEESWFDAGVATMTKAEVGRIQRRAGRVHSARELGFVLPWAVDHLNDEERGTFFANESFDVCVLWLLNRGRYRRLARAAGMTSG